MFKKRTRTYKSLIISTLLVFSIIFLIFQSQVIGKQEEWNYETLTSQNRELHEAPSIAAYENNIHIVWNCYHTEFETKIYYIKSTDNGKTWSNITELSSDTESATYPAVAAQGNSVHVAWQDTKNKYPQIYYRRSIDNGLNWGPIKRLVYNSTDLDNVNIGVSGNNIYLMWKDYKRWEEYNESNPVRHGAEIYLKRSKDNGETWEPEQRLTNDFEPSYNPFLSVENNNIYIIYDEAWVRNDIVFIKSTDKGEQWSQRIYLTDVQKNGESEYPTLDTNENNLYAVWQDSRTGKREIYFKKSDDYGKSWNEIVQLTNDDIRYSSPKIKSYGNKLTVIWQSKKAIWYKTSQDRGETWSKTIQIAENNSNPASATLAIQGNNCHIVYQEYNNTYGDICYMNNVNNSSNMPDNGKTNNNEDFLPDFTIYSFIIAILIITLAVKFYAKKK